jgi:hypothetical protein
MKRQKQGGITVFFSYAQADQKMRDRLAIHLSQLQRDGLIEAWSDQQILAGANRTQEIDQAIRRSRIILLLISADFLASDTCYDVEMQQALEHHRRGEVHVIPIIVRPCDWQNSPFAHLLCLPRNTRPVALWGNQDEAFVAIAQELREVIAQQPLLRPSKPIANDGGGSLEHDSNSKEKNDEEVRKPSQQEFLGENGHTQENHSHEQIITSNEQIKVLLVFANPRGTDSLQLGREERAIREALRLGAHREKIAVTTCHATTIHDFRRALLAEKFQIVHISGHGSQNGLVLENELGGEQRIPQSALAKLLQAYSPPLQCILLNACYSASQGQLIFLEIPFAIATESPINDRAAIEFSRGFYDALGAGRTIDFAYEEGCRTVQLTVPGVPFIAQILARDNHLRCFSLQKDEPLPAGYACISLSTGNVAVKPTRYQSLQMLLDDLYAHAMRNEASSKRADSEENVSLKICYRRSPMP